MVEEVATGQEEGTFLVKGPPAEGFTILYNGIAKTLLSEHSAVLRCYLTLCLYSNGDRESHPSMITLAKDMGMSESSAIRAIKRLESLGLIKVTRPKTNGRGLANTYWLLPPKKVSPMKGITDKGVMGAEENLSPVTPQQETLEQEKDSSPLPPSEDTHDEDVEEAAVLAKSSVPSSVVTKADLDRLTHQDNGAQSSAGAPTASSRVSNFVGRENDHPFWEENPRQRKLLNTIIEKWPKATGRIEAMVAWREVVGERITTTPGMDKHIWNGFHWWLNYWKEKGTEERFIPQMANWIRKERWNDAQVVAEQ